MSRDSPFIKDTEAFTKLIDKYAVHISTYLSRKSKCFSKHFFAIIVEFQNKNLVVIGMRSWIERKIVVLEQS